jgi:hypothetical protein
MIYRVILTYNGKYKKTLHTCKTKETSFINYHNLIEKNKQIKFPKKFVNTLKIKPVKYKICVIKPTEPTDTFRTIRDDYGKTYVEKPIGDWTILASSDYQLEETFWIFGLNSKANRPTINEVVKRLVSGAYKAKMVKQVIVVHNKLVIYNEDQFDMVVCKCKEDAQRLHHVLNKIAKKQKIKSLMFMGTATPATVSRMYEIIHEHTKWPMTKIRRRSTRP